MEPTPTRNDGESALPTNQAPTPQGVGSGEHSTAPTIAENMPPPGPVTGGEQIIPGYVLLEKLGEGGMGVVWKARQVGLNRLVALKMIRTAGPLTPDQLARFRNEAEAVARLQHPNIVQIYEIGEQAGCPWFSLEFCAGGSLDRRLGGQPLPPREGAHIVEALARAMQVAHQNRVVHRDLKPANVLLASGGREPPVGAETGGSRPSLAGLVARISDFGLAKQLDLDQGHTRTGQIIGTPSYMAPEQAEGHSELIGPCSDIYSLGAILYECLTGKPPFRAASMVSTLQQVVHEEPQAPARLGVAVHRDLETICLKCLRKDPRSRYGSAGELADDLRRFLDGVPIQARPPTRRERLGHWCKRRPALSALAGTALLALLVLVPVGLAYRARLADADARAEQSQRDRDVAASLAELALKAEESARETAATQSYFALLSRTRERTSRGDLGWSAAGLEDLRQAARVPTLARNLEELRTEMTACLGGIDLRRKRAYQFNFLAETLLRLPDGKRLAVASARAWAYAGPCVVDVIDIETGKVERRLTFSGDLFLKGPDGARALACSRDGRLLAVGTRGGKVHCWDLEQPEAPPRSATLIAGQPIEFLLFDPAGKVLFAASSQDRHLVRWSLAEGKETSRFSARRTVISGLDLTSDGKLLVVACDDQIHLFHPETLTAARPAWPLSAGFLRFSPSDQVLAAWLDRRILLLEVCTGKRIRRFPDSDAETTHEGLFGQFAFTPDGSILISVGTDAEDRKVKLWEVSSGRLLGTVHAGGSGPLSAHLSEGELALVTRPDGRTGSEAIRYEITGQEVQRLLAQHEYPVRAVRFAPGGQALACTAGRRNDDGTGHALVSVWDPATGRMIDQRGYYPQNFDLGVLTYHPGEPVLASTGWGSPLELWERGTPVRSFPIKEPRTLEFSPCGKVLWGVLEEQVVQSWSWPQMKVRTRWSNALQKTISGLSGVYSLSPGREWVVVGCRDGSVRILSAEDGKPRHDQPLASGAVWSVNLSPDEQRAVAGTHSGDVVILEMPTGKILGRLRDHRDRVDAVCHSPDGRWLATGGRDRRLHLYQCEGGTYRRLLTLPPATGPITSLSFSPDGSRLAVVVQQETAVRLWRIDRLLEQLQANLGE